MSVQPKTMPFGKYKNSTLEKVLNEDRQYVMWLLMQNELIDKFPEIRDYFLEGIGQEPDASYIMRWGKYKGHTLKYVAENDTKYIEYLRCSEFVNSRCKRLTEELRNF
jgi:uncharacterized protein (DUF3820 family)